MPDDLEPSDDLPAKVSLAKLRGIAKLRDEAFVSE